MSFLAFIRDNLRWLAGGFLLTYFSSFGQTFFISLSAGDIRAEYGLSHGQFGTLYMVATLASAASLPFVGRIVDWKTPRQVTFIIVPILAVACISMAFANHVALLLLAIYLLRLFGQGMMSQNAFTAVGRWFVGQRGKATSLTAIGVNAGEATFPILFVLIAGALGWRNAWLVAAVMLVLVAMPAISALVAADRKPQASDTTGPSRAARDWTRGEVMRDPLFYLAMSGVLAPGFIGTTIFFHQIYLVELRGWSLELFAASFTVMAATVVTFSIIAGFLVDRFSAKAVLPTFLIPLGLACIVLALVEAQWASFAFMILLGVSYGFTNTVFGALWPEIYGVKHLGAIRAMTVAFGVLATAIGPGLTGYLIDIGVSYPAQILTMGIYCLAICLVLVGVSQRLIAREAAEAGPLPMAGAWGTRKP
ncbi:MFS transporter [Mesorhizobium sp. CAU 1741]|uniref:MFS transporter n=1 Tax=Mesorhizobium sp. CAU 1741 TaxID=3140366 RepID=UPI00325BB03E